MSSISPSRTWPAMRPAPNSSSPSSGATASCSRTCLEVSSISPKPTTRCIRRKNSSSGQVAKLFGFTDTEFSYIKARHVIAAERNPYDVLGVEPSVSDEELKCHYRMLVADNQPDKLIALGADGVRHHCHREGRHQQQGL